MKILTNHHHLLLLYKKPPDPQIFLLNITTQKLPSLKTNTNTKKPQTFSPIPSLSSKSKCSLSPSPNPNPNPNPNLNPPPPMATCIGAAQPSPLSRNPNRPHPDDSAAGNASHGLNFLKLSHRKFSDHAPNSSAATATATTVFRGPKPVIGDHDDDDDDDDDDLDLWREIKSEALSDAESEPVLKPYLVDSVLSHASLESALANQLSVKLGRDSSIPRQALYEIFVQVLREDPEIMRSTVFDLRAVKERDPACVSHVHCLLNFKGFLAIQAHRMAHGLWDRGRRALALTLHSRASEAFAVDIHPGARVGRGVLLDHATGVVVGETAVIGDHVSILHNVTLGGTGKVGGDRHPKIGDGVLIGAGTCILGNIRIGEGAKIGAGSVVLKDVPAWTTAVGNPARLIGGKSNPVRNDKVPGLTMDHTSHISEWSDYVI